MCVTRMKANSMLCVGCNKWVHKKCSGVKCSLKKVEAVFHCDVCVQEKMWSRMDNGTEMVEGFGFIGDKLNAGGGW